MWISFILSSGTIFRKWVYAHKLVEYLTIWMNRRPLLTLFFFFFPSYRCISPFGFSYEKQKPILVMFDILMAFVSYVLGDCCYLIFFELFLMGLALAVHSVTLLIKMQLFVFYLFVSRRGLAIFPRYLNCLERWQHHALDSLAQILHRLDMPNHRLAQQEAVDWGNIYETVIHKDRKQVDYCRRHQNHSSGNLSNRSHYFRNNILRLPCASWSSCGFCVVILYSVEAERFSCINYRTPSATTS